MDFDYYIIVTLLVECVKNDIIETHFIEFERFKMYYLLTYGHDENEPEYDKIIKDEMEYMNQTYSRMDSTIYENKKWNINNENTIIDYRGI